jgi:hypothetical protein
MASAPTKENVPSSSSRPLGVSAGKSSVVYSTISDIDISMIALAEV